MNPYVHGIYYRAAVGRSQPKAEKQEKVGNYDDSCLYFSLIVLVQCGNCEQEHFQTQQWIKADKSKLQTSKSSSLIWVQVWLQINVLWLQLLDFCAI